MQIPSMQELLEAGVHFGHQARRWHPKMAQFIYGAKDGVHIIDLEKTVDRLGQAAKFLAEVTKTNGKILFVGTKKQAQEIIKTEAQRAKVHWICEHWIGGLITNFDEIYKNIEKMIDLEEKRKSGEFGQFTKKERLLVDRKITKLEKVYGGLRNLDTVPDAIFIVDVKKEETAAREAKRRGVPVVAICDTNANLALVDYPIPGNDDAIRSVRILVKTVADAIVEGTQPSRKATAGEEKGIREEVKGKREEPSVAKAMEGKEEKEEKEEVKKKISKSAKTKKEVKTKEVRKKPTTSKKSSTKKSKQKKGVKNKNGRK